MTRTHSDVVYGMAFDTKSEAMDALLDWREKNPELVKTMNMAVIEFGRGFAWTAGPKDCSAQDGDG